MINIYELHNESILVSDKNLFWEFIKSTGQIKEFELFKKAVVVKTIQVDE